MHTLMHIYIYFINIRTCSYIPVCSCILDIILAIIASYVLHKYLCMYIHNFLYVNIAMANNISSLFTVTCTLITPFSNIILYVYLIM